MRERAKLYILPISIKKNKNTTSWNMESIRKRSNEVVFISICTPARKKETTVKQHLFKRITLPAVQKQNFSHSQNAHQNILHYLLQRNTLVSFLQPYFVWATKTANNTKWIFCISLFFFATFWNVQHNRYALLHWVANGRSGYGNVYSIARLPAQRIQFMNAHF